MDKYLIHINDLKYAKDKNQNKMLPVKEIVETNSLPSHGEEKVLYILHDASFYSCNSVFYQVELEEVEKATETKKINKIEEK